MDLNINKTSCELSVVIPIFNEEATVAALTHALVEEFRENQQNFEIILVNDGSTDRSLDVIKTMTKSYHGQVRGLSFARNYGQTFAFSAGTQQATGKVIVWMDGDFQNDPRDVLKLTRQLGPTVDLVCGWRKMRQDGMFRVMLSRMANRWISKISGLKLHDYGCSLKAFKADVIRSIRLTGDMHRMVPVYCFWQGASVKEVVVRHRPRQAGQSKYGMARVYKVLLDLFFLKFYLFSAQKPLYFFGKYGLWFIGLIPIFIVLSQRWLHVDREILLIALLLSVLLALGLLMIFFGMGLEIRGRNPAQDADPRWRYAQFFD